MLNDLILTYSASPALFAGSTFLFGIVVGSFLNVVIFRLPIMLEREWRTQANQLLSVDHDPLSAEKLTLSTPGSRCPGCKTPIKPWQNIPLFSWLVLRGRCAGC